MNNDCIFCKIAKKEIPCSKIFENKDFLVFLDIKPVTDGHLLIIPKDHVVWMQEAPDKMIGDIFKLTKKFMLTLKKSLKCHRVELIVDGIKISHFHIHLIPRYINDGFSDFPAKEYKKGEAEIIKKKIIKYIK